MIRTLLIGGLTVFVAALTALAAEQTWTGKISDDKCGASHKAATEHAGSTMSDRDCILACVKNGAKYVFVSQGKVYKIKNQDFAALEEHAGHMVRLTGERTGDSIAVSKIEILGSRKK